MRSRPLDRLANWGLAALAVLALGLGFTGLVRAAPEPLQQRPGGALRIAGSGGERAVLSGAGLAPGESVHGAVTIADRGSAPATLTLSSLDLAGGGGPLAAALWLTVRDVTRGSDGIVYAGPLAGLRTLRVGALGPGEQRRYAFAATLPDPGPDVVDDALAGAWTSFDFAWRLSEAGARPCATRISGDAGANRVLGTLGGDRVAGGRGPDRLLGGEGEDCLDGGPGRDLLAGGPGDDTIRARDGSPDRVDCGPGEDLATADRRDRLTACEHVRR